MGGCGLDLSGSRYKELGDGGGGLVNTTVGVSEGIC